MAMDAVVQRLKGDTHSEHGPDNLHSERGALAWSFSREGEGGDGEDEPSHDIGASRSGLAGAGREAIGERDDQVAEFIGALDDERTVE